MEGYEHFLSPEGVIAALVCGLFIDVWSVGPTKWQDRLAWVFYFVGIAEGFGGSMLANWTVGKLANVISQGMVKGNEHYMFAARADDVIGIFMCAVTVFTMFALVPTSWKKWFGGATSLGFRNPFKSSGFSDGDIAESKYRINTWVLTSAALLGIFYDTPQGGIGWFLRGFLYWVSWPVSTVIHVAFGV